MKKGYLFLTLIFLSALALKAQNRNATVKILNHYIAYSNSNIKALKAVQHDLESYNDLFNGYLRKDRKLGGETYEKPKASPFVDSDVFYMNEDNPDFLYSVALKESAALPANVKTDLNASMKSMKTCSQRLVKLVDSMSLIFSGPLISVTKNENVLPYSLLAEARRQLQLSKKYRDQLFAGVTAYYNKTSPLNAPAGDYIRSAEELKKGVVLCQKILNDLSKNDSTHLPQYVQSLDSLYNYLYKSELTLLKGIEPTGNSRQFPNKGNFDGFDLYNKYEDILIQFQKLGNFARYFTTKPNRIRCAPERKCYEYHKEISSDYNSNGLIYYYNEYVLLIGGGKMKIDSEVGILMRGWHDRKNNTLPVRTILLWTTETPRFEIEYPN